MNGTIARRVPTIIAVDKKGKKHDYNKERTTEDFVKFMKEVLSNTPQKGGRKKRKGTKRRKKTNMRKSKRYRKSKKARKTKKTKKAKNIKRK